VTHGITTLFVEQQPVLSSSDREFGTFMKELRSLKQSLSVWQRNLEERRKANRKKAAKSNNNSTITVDDEEDAKEDKLLYLEYSIDAFLTSLGDSAGRRQQRVGILGGTGDDAAALQWVQQQCQQAKKLQEEAKQLLMS
jgi:hypothetical protein